MLEAYFKGRPHDHQMLSGRDLFVVEAECHVQYWPMALRTYLQKNENMSESPHISSGSLGKHADWADTCAKEGCPGSQFGWDGI